jgi:ABC-type multidrug transport system fused ATPase/permease subunit
MVMGGLLEVFGIGLLYPYIAILQDPSKITTNHYTDAIYRYLAFTSSQSFSVFLSVFLLAIFCSKAVFAIWMSDFQVRFIYGKHSQVARDLLTQYLKQPYSFFLSTNTSILIGNVTTSLNQVFAGAVQAVLATVSEFIVLAGLLVVLALLSPAVTMVGLALVGGVSILFIRSVKSRVARYGTESDIHWKAMIRTVNEAVSSAKEIKVLGRAQFFVDQFTYESDKFLWAYGRNTILSQLPRVTLETGAVAVLILVAMVAILYQRSQEGLFAILAIFALATVRLVPSANRILRAWNDIIYNLPAIEMVGRLVATLAAPEQLPDAEVQGTKLPLHRAMSISIKSFSYPANPNFSLRNIELTINKGQTVAFIGHSGSGKTTLVDLILGLFPQFEGEILVDGCDIKKDIMAWRRSIGYIAQSLYMSDDTIARNVAFGVPADDIDINKLARAIKLAGLDPVIQSQPAGLNTVIGDRGIRLSGGERQRIGIARALYHDPELLILDEATSALDNETERQIVDSILGLSPAKTIIMIAHRLTTVKHCDVVYLIRDGLISDHGSFREVSERNSGLTGEFSDSTLANG